MQNEQEPTIMESETPNTEKTSEEFLNEMYDMTDIVCSCKNNPTESNATEIAKCLSFVKTHSTEIRRAVSENKKGVLRLIIELSNYCLSPKLQNNNDGPTPDGLKEQILREKTSVELLSFLNEMTSTLCDYVSDSFRTAINENTSAHHTLASFSLARNYLRLALVKNIDSEKHSILNAIRVIEPLSSILEKLKQTRVEESPLSLINAIKRGNYLLLHIGDPKIIQEYVDDFVNDEEIEDFDFLSYENLFPGDERTSYWDEQISTKLLSLSEEREAGSSDYSEFEIQRARQLILNVPREKIMMGILKRYQLPYQPIANAWIKSSKPEHMGYWHGGNLQAIRDLEKENPECTKKLFDTNGIRCFARYKKEFLLEQLNPPSEDEPRGLMVSRYDDWNGAFSGPQMETAHNKIREASKKLGIKVRIAEYDDTIDLFYRLQTMCAKSESDPELTKAEYVWINQHGDTVKKIIQDPVTKKETVTEEDDPIKMKQVKENWEYILGIGENRESLITDTVACLMCSGGEKNNVMDIIAQNYKEDGVIAIGPSHTTQGIKSISFNRDEETGKLSIDIDYDYYAKDPDSEKGKTVRYDYSNNNESKEYLSNL
jgi:hypothetical protein